MYAGALFFEEENYEKSKRLFFENRNSFVERVGLCDGGSCFVLKYFDTANIAPSTLSGTTSFVAVYLTYRHSPYFALAYTANICGFW